MKNMTLDDKPTTFDIQRAIRGSAAIRNFFGVEKKDEEEEDMTRAEAAKELGISEKTVSCYMTNGVLKSGGWGVVDDSSVVAFKAKPKKEKLKAALPVKTKEQDPAKLDTIRALISKAYFAGYDDGYSDGQSNSLSSTKNPYFLPYSSCGTGGLNPCEALFYRHLPDLLLF